MSSHYSSRVRARLVPPLSDWISVVASVTGGKFSVRGVSEAGYHEKHGRLLRACRACPEAEALCHKLTALVEPWVSAETLKKADKRVVVDLLARLRSIESQLTGKKPISRRTVRLLLCASVAVIAATTLYVACQTSDQWVNWDSAARIRALGYRGVRYVRATSSVARVGVIACVVVACGTLLLRGVRKY